MRWVRQEAVMLLAGLMTSFSLLLANALMQFMVHNLVLSSVYCPTSPPLTLCHHRPVLDSSRATPQ